MAPKWRHREGNIGEGEVYDPTEQDSIVKAVMEKQAAMAAEREQILKDERSDVEVATVLLPNEIPEVLASVDE